MFVFNAKRSCENEFSQLLTISQRPVTSGHKQKGTMIFHSPFYSTYSIINFASRTRNPVVSRMRTRAFAQSFTSKRVFGSMQYSFKPFHFCRSVGFSASFIAQCIDRIQQGGLLSRIQAEEQADAYGEHHGDDDGQDGDNDRPPYDLRRNG